MPTAIIGTGRSGTSLVARLLNLAGLYLGKEQDMLPAAVTNTKGHWEHRKIYEINFSLLDYFGGSWEEPPRLPPNWFKFDDLAPLRQEATDFINATFAGQPHWGWKEPRTTITIPFWQQIVPDLRYVVCLRNPLEFAASVSSPAYNISSNHAMALWQFYTEQSFFNTCPNERIVVFYEDFFVDCYKTLAPILAFLGLAPLEPGSEGAKAIEAFFDKSLRHKTNSYQDVMSSPLVPASVKLLYDAVLQRPTMVDTLFSYPISDSLGGFQVAVADETRQRLVKSVKQLENLEIYVRHLQTDLQESQSTYSKLEQSYLHQQEYIKELEVKYSEPSNAHQVLNANGDVQPKLSVTNGANLANEAGLIKLEAEASEQKFNELLIYVRHVEAEYQKKIIELQHLEAIQAKADKGVVKVFRQATNLLLSQSKNGRGKDFGS